MPGWNEIPVLLIAQAGELFCPARGLRHLEATYRNPSKFSGQRPHRSTGVDHEALGPRPSSIVDGLACL
jgi:hypothetical protein